ncbi:MAG: hypothetical protein IPH12_14240 [Saprospirales bacterium]|nr:hypothetical protein [Saprospirales bacterium]MBK8924067.1 hypothetical protein [Saprospirales bacterium]
MHCPNCGHTAQPGLARCGHCNFKLPETALPAAAPAACKINCWNCTHENPSHALRCIQCNVNLEKPIVQHIRTARTATNFTPNTSSHDE